MGKEKEYGFSEKKQKIYLKYSTDIFKGGALYYEKDKNILQKQLNKKEFTNKINLKKIKVYTLVLKLKKIDFKLQQKNYLLSNILFKISKKENSSLLLRKYELKNSIEDLLIYKNSLLSSLKRISSKQYKTILIQNLEVNTFEDFINKNSSYDIHTINLKVAKLDQKIKNAKLLPKISFYSQIGHRFDKYKSSNYDYQGEEEDTYYEYGFYLSFPLDIKKSKKNKLASLKYLQAEKSQNIRKENISNKYIQVKNDIRSLDKKIENHHKIYFLKEELYLNKQQKEDMHIITNKLKYEKLKIAILKLEKQLLFYEFFNL